MIWDWLKRQLEKVAQKHEQGVKGGFVGAFLGVLFMTIVAFFVRKGESDETDADRSSDVGLGEPGDRSSD
jgi:hypothetical protein